jgi:predicted DNA repair protein MutK
MPVFLKILGIVGTAAMIWVGGGIIVHGLEEYGVPFLGQAIHRAAEVAADALPVSGLVEWVVTAGGSGVVGLLVGLALIPVAGFVLAPAWKAVTGLRAA